MIIAGTGHRPDKLGGYGEPSWTKIFKLAYEFLEKNEHNIDLVISGGAIGWDSALALASYELDIKYILAVPFVGQEKMWPKEGLYSQDFYNDLKSNAYKVEIICPGGYASWKMQRRNEWMVNNADLILALWNGSSGGTANCIKYAESKNKKIINLWEQYESCNIRK